MRPGSYTELFFLDEATALAALDRSRHVARVDRRRGKVTFQAPLADLPDGAMFTCDAVTYLKGRGWAKPWSLKGYGQELALSPDREVTVLTPRPTVDVLRMGYAPGLHATADVRQAVEEARTPGG